MPTIDLDQKRLEILGDTIDQVFYGNAVKSDMPFDSIITEMFEVIDVNKTGVVLMHLFDDIEYKPVFCAKEILHLLRPHDSFLMTIAKSNKKWHVLEMSPPYMSETIDMSLDS